LGRTSVRQSAPGQYRVSSFFDIWTELTLDGGATWQPSTTGPASMRLNTANAVAITCPADITVTAPTLAGAVVNYPAPATSGACTPFSVVCNPPSASTFPIGTTPVNCAVADSCGNTAACSFLVTVNPPAAQNGPEIFFPSPNLPP